MGYAHYWYRDEKLDSNIFKAYAKDIHVMLSNASCYIGNWAGDAGSTFEASNDLVSFNGIPGCETFSFPCNFDMSGYVSKDPDGKIFSYVSKDPDGKIFSFTKTNYEKYDKYVVGALILAQYHFGDSIYIRSDGFASDFGKGLDIVRNQFGYDIEISSDKDEETGNLIFDIKKKGKKSTGSPKNRKRDTIVEFETSPDRIRQIMEMAGGSIGSVHFRKRRTNELRKMCYKLHVKSPSVAPTPKGNSRKGIDKKNDQMTVFDVNKVVRKDGEIVGRGAYRVVPLENVVRICVKGKIYQIAGRS
jgi:hypothetical protein